MWLFVLIFLSVSKASVPDMLGASATSAGIGLLPHAETDQAALNANVASLLGFTSKSSFSVNFAVYKPHFKKIHHIVIGNEMNTDDGVEVVGAAQVPEASENLFIGNLVTPLFSEKGPKLGLSFYAPLDRIAESSSGDPYLPEYVMYRSRLSRSALIFNLIKKFDKWSFSLGAYSGFQARGETFFIASTSGASSPSAGRVDFNAKPSLAGLASVSYQHESGVSYLGWQQQMKSRFETTASGFTPVGGGSLPFDLKMNSMAYYDPMTIKLGHQFNFEDWRLFMGAQYEKWKGYQTPRLKMRQVGGVILSSGPEEKIHLENTWSPQIGVEKKEEKFKWRLGYMYKPSPLGKSHLHGASNSLDPDAHIGTFGFGLPLTAWGQPMEINLGYQYRLLENFKVTKTPLQENGSAGRKLGAPGYRVGGNIQSVMIGLSWQVL
jgi:hypothetical protein